MTDPPKPEQQKRGAIAWTAGHSVVANLVMLLCIVGGYLSLRNIKQEVFPEIERDEVTVAVPYPGASPEEVERGIVLAVEEAVRGLDGVDEIRSAAREGSGSVTVELLVEADLHKTAQDIQAEVDRITTFPEDAEEPRVRIASHKRQVLSVVLHGRAEDTTLHELAEQLRDRLLQDPNITQVDLAGVRPLEIAVEIPQANLRRYNLTLQEAANRIRSASVDLPAGGIKTPGGEILVRMKERRDYGRQFADLPVISAPDGGQVLLGQIATIDDSFQDVDRYATFNGRPAVMLQVYRVGDQTPIQVADAVRRHLEQLRPVLPPGIEVDIRRDRSGIYRQRVELLLRNGALGLVLVLVILGLFLEVRLAFWVMMGIPISFLGSFLVLPATGVTVNMISLFAYIIALGIVVDDAIVVGENIYHYHQEGLPFSRAAVKGARDVVVPVTFSILTNIVAFMPIYFVPGMMGKVFRMIPIVVVTVFLISLGESLFVLPAHLGHQRDRRRRGLSAWLHARQQAFSHGFRRWVRNRYGPFLRLALRHRYLTIATALALLIAMLSYALSGRMGFGLFPKIESDSARATLVMPYGSAVAKTEAVMQRMLRAARQVVDECGRPQLVTGIFAEVGRDGSHTGTMRVYLAEPEVREKIMGTEEFTRRWRKAVGQVVGTEYLLFESDAGGPGHGAALTIELSHRNISVLEKAGADLATAFRSYPQVKDVNDGFLPGKQQLDFAIRPEGKSLGLTARGVARQVRNAFYGAEALRQQRGRNEIKVMVRLPESERISEHSVNELILRTPAGTEVPLREVAAVERGRAYTAISRRNGKRTVHVTADATPRSKAGEVLEDLKTDTLPRLVDEYSGLNYSFEGRRADMRESLASLKVGFILAMLAVYALLAVPFRSYYQPLIVMMSIPFGIVGAFIGHLLMGYDLSIMSMFGIVALSGVVVNDSLIMIDFANRLRKQSDGTNRDVIVAAAIQRFRPILLTTVTTFGGLAPMIFETSRQARFLIPMALSLGFGLLFATLITLVLVPSLYLAIEDVKSIAATGLRLLLTPGANVGMTAPGPPETTDRSARNGG